MKYCSKAAHALCTYRKYCEPDALLEDDSECDIFNQYIANRALTDADDFSQSVITPVITVADHIRAMTDEELAKWLAKLLADYTSLLYDGEYTPSEDAVSEITGELLRQLQQPYESLTGQKG